MEDAFCKQAAAASRRVAHRTDGISSLALPSDSEPGSIGGGLGGGGGGEWEEAGNEESEGGGTLGQGLGLKVHWDGLSTMMAAEFVRCS